MASSCYLKANKHIFLMCKIKTKSGNCVKVVFCL